MYTIINESTNHPIHKPDTADGAVCTGTLVQTKNEIDSLTLTMYPDNPCWDELVEMVTLVSAHNETTDKDEFYGRVLSVIPNMDSRGVISKTVVCEGALGFMRDSVFGFRKMEGRTPTNLLTAMVSVHNNQCADNAWKQVQVGNVTETASNFSQLEVYRSTAEILMSAAGLAGGRIQARREDGVTYIDWLADDTATDTSNAIVLGINMLSFSRDFDPTDICTRLFAWGVERVPLAITRQPESSVGQVDKRWSVSVTADGATAYQWQRSSNGTTWVNLEHYNSSMDLKVDSSTFSYYFRCFIAGQEGQTVYTDTVRCLQESEESEGYDYEEEEETAPDETVTVNVDRIDLTSLLNRKYITAADTGGEDIEATVGVINGYYVTGEAETASELLTLAKSEFSRRNNLEYQFKAEVVDLVYRGKTTQTFQVGHRYAIKNSFFDVDETVELVGRTVNIQTPHLPTLQLGAKATTMTKILAMEVRNRA